MQWLDITKAMYSLYNTFMHLYMQILMSVLLIMEVVNRTATTLLGRTTAPAILGTSWAMTTTAVQVDGCFNSLH